MLRNNILGREVSTIPINRHSGLNGLRRGYLVGSPIGVSHSSQEGASPPNSTTHHGRDTIALAFRRYALTGVCQVTRISCGCSLVPTKTPRPCTQGLGTGRDGPKKGPGRARTRPGQDPQARMTLLAASYRMACSCRMDTILQA